MASIEQDLSSHVKPPCQKGAARGVTVSSAGSNVAFGRNQSNAHKGLWTIARGRMDRGIGNLFFGRFFPALKGPSHLFIKSEYGQASAPLKEPFVLSQKNAMSHTQILLALKGPSILVQGNAVSHTQISLALKGLSILAQGSALGKIAVEVGSPERAL
ncbi:MAG: hypothetical protein N3D11_13405 [Candidatus Sumerlaeia bacterium]|nr:hypothetical protein [Candidatus Sumerlaeia bacterium]